jgi:hypothetical protein
VQIGSCRKVSTKKLSFAPGVKFGRGKHQSPREAMFCKLWVNDGIWQGGEQSVVESTALALIDCRTLVRFDLLVQLGGNCR